TRTITILAKGIGGSQLPDLKSQLETPDFKVYEDRPVTGQEVKEGSIHGWKTATYTLIPRKDGELTLPEIKVPWWDIQNNRLAEAILPAKTISIAPGEAGSIERPEPEQKAQEPEQLVEETITETETSREPASAVKAEPETQSILHIVILLLLLGLIGVFTWGVRMYRQNNRASQIRPHPMKRRETKSPKKMAKLPIAKINSIQDLIELQEFLKAYSRDHWGTSTNASLREISDVLLAQEPDLDKDFVLLLFKKLDEALYANKKVDIVAWKVDFQKVIKQTASKQSGAKNKSSEGLPDLNPR
ncbi:MAG: hypothetical protein HOK20_02465, partial [Alphaproteobacteria bacterium]|nr:hypothetical protein [Alphaproteobacteria bacterium]